METARSLPKILPVAGAKRSAPSKNTIAAGSTANQAAGLFHNEDEDAMDITGDDQMLADDECCHNTKRLKTQATTGQGNEVLAFSAASSNKSLVDPGLPVTDDTDSNTTMRHQPAQSLAQDDENQAKDVSPKGNTAGLLFSLAAVTPAQIAHLHMNYSFSPIEIGTNSKHDQVVQAVVSRVRCFNIADMHMKPTIVVLSSPANFAAKLIAIVEAAKSQIAADHENWFQYNEMHGVALPQVPRFEKRISAGTTLQQWIKDQHTKVEAKKAAKAAKAAATAEAAEAAKEDVMDVDEDVFQTMVRRKSEDSQALDAEHERRRHLPIITVFITRLRIPELAALYG
ncbi:hypothetical protein MMC07_006050 [Pseudocyphellaria aurata]|nr:hypothetical protein [Pseudocyphellaria aurata]